MNPRNASEFQRRSYTQLSVQQLPREAPKPLGLVGCVPMLWSQFAALSAWRFLQRCLH